jgi:hypothetical protein
MQHKLRGLCSVPYGPLDLLNVINHSSCTMCLKLTQPLTEVSTTNLPELKGGRRLIPSTILLSMCRFFTSCGSLDVLSSHGPPTSLQG